MLTIVLAINAVLALMCLYTMGQLWQIRQVLAKVADTLTSVERKTYDVLHLAPDAIIKGRRGTRSLRYQYHELATQLEKVQQVLALLSLGQKAWSRRSSGRQAQSVKKPFSKF